MRLILSAGLIALLLVGFQAEPASALSVEEAKKVSEGFETATAVPPPRSIEDVAAILDSQKPNEGYRARLLEELNATPPSNATPATLATFYQERAKAAMRAGLRGQALADAREGVRYARTADEGLHVPREAPFRTHRALALLLQVQTNAGESGLDTAKEIYSGSDYGFSTARARAISSLIHASVLSGNLVEARMRLNESDYILEEAAIPRSFNGLATRTSAWMIRNIREINAQQHGFVEENAGNFTDAESWYRKALSYCEELLTTSLVPAPSPATARPLPGEIDVRYANDVQIASCRKDLVHILSLQDRALEAETVARDGLLYALRRTGKSSGDSADGIAMLGSALYEQGRYRDAETLSRAEVSLREALGIQSFDARNTLADALAMQGRYGEAVELFDGAEKERSDLPSYRSFSRVMSLYQVGRIDDGVALAQSIGDTYAKRYGPSAYLTALARGYTAVGRKLKGDSAEAASAYREVRPQLLIALQPDGRDALRSPVLQVHRRYVLEGDLELLAGASRGVHDLESGLQVADALGSGVTDRALIASAARAALPNTEISDLSRREQDARDQLSAHLTILAGALSQPVEQQNSAAILSLRGDIEKLKQAHATLSQEIERRYPAYARLVNPTPATVEQARTALTTDEALVALYAGEHESYVWALRRDGPLAFAVVPLTRAQLAEQVALLRHALDPGAASLSEIPPFDVTLAYSLYAALFKSVESGWKGAKQLVVVPSGPLAQMPFSLLVTKPVTQPKDGGGVLFSGYREVPFLARKVALSQVPSVASLISLRALAHSNPARKPFVGFGDPWFTAAQAAQAGAEAGAETRSFHLRATPETETLRSANLTMLPRLPDTAAEVREVAVTLHADPSKDVFLGAAANEWQVRNMKLDDRRVVMFATHGLVPGDLDGLDQPALALSAPSVAKVDGNGLLTMDKILGLKLDADWVVLSACNTAAGSGAGAEAVSGLGRAFFYAGARALLVTHWPVETTSARQLTTQTFRLQAADSTLTRAEALRASMLNLIDSPGYVDPQSGKIVYSYAHPMFWAPFSLVGDGR